MSEPTLKYERQVNAGALAYALASANGLTNYNISYHWKGDSLVRTLFIHPRDGSRPANIVDTLDESFFAVVAFTSESPIIPGGRIYDRGRALGFDIQSGKTQVTPEMIAKAERELGLIQFNH